MHNQGRSVQTGLMVGAGVPVAQIEALVLAGLPEEVDRVVNGRSISFLLRAVPFDLDSSDATGNEAVPAE